MVDSGLKVHPEGTGGAGVWSVRTQRSALEGGSGSRAPSAETCSGARAKHPRRPSFFRAAPGARGKELFEGP